MYTRKNPFQVAPAVALLLAMLLLAGGCGADSGEYTYLEDDTVAADESAATTSADAESAGQETAAADTNDAETAAATDAETAAPASTEAPAGSLPASVLRVVDGDTIEVDLEGTKETVRMIGVDTLESVHRDADRNVPYGKVATAYTESMLDGKDVMLELDVEERDKYGRLLAYVWLGDVMFNELLVAEGHASILTYPPNVKYKELFTAAQTEARDAGKGQWAENLPFEDEPASAAQEEPASDSSASQSEDGAYIGTTTTYKFHTRDCTWGKKIKSHNAVYFATREAAIDAGFTPCKVCNP
jgi:micrococcal nuclease